MHSRKPSSWSELLRERYAPPPARPASEFWEEFRHKAVGRKRAETRRMLRYAWAVPAAAQVRGPGPDVDDVDVLVENGSVIIMQDPQRRATVVWLSLPPHRM